MCTLAKSEDTDEMMHNAAFHQGLHYLQFREKKIWNFYHVTPGYIKWTILSFMHQAISA